MSQSLPAVYIHLVFSTKNREPFLVNPLLRDRIFRFLASASAKLNCPIKHIGGMPDHVHILAHLGKEISLASWIKEIKRTSSRTAKTLDPTLRRFAWQGGYGAFSVSQSGIADVANYIATQEEHHRTMSFQEEFLRILKKHNLAYDEKYLWE